jgi:uncharacterized protein YneF (UPF0154 family)
MGELINFFKKHILLVINIVLIIIMIIVLIIGGFIKIKPSTQSQNNNPFNNEQLQNPFITDLNIGKSSKNSFTCMPGYNTIPICDLNNNCTQQSMNLGTLPNVQLCQSSCSLQSGNCDNYTLNDQTTVVTDVKFNDMTDSTNNIYVPISNRCCNGPSDVNCKWFPPLSIDVLNPNAEDAGELPITINSCKKQGLCIQKQTIQNLKQSKGKYLPFNNIYLVNAPGTIDKSHICDSVNANYGGGFITDGIGLSLNCAGLNDIFICKKFNSL